MELKLHANATTIPRTRRLIQQSTKPAARLAKELGISASTVRIWRKRDSVQDRSHTAHRLQTTLSPEQEWLVVEIRKS